MVQVVDTRDPGTGADRVTDLVTHPMKEQNLSSLHASGMSLHQQDSIILIVRRITVHPGPAAPGPRRHPQMVLLSAWAPAAGTAASQAQMAAARLVGKWCLCTKMAKRELGMSELLNE